MKKIYFAIFVLMAMLSSSVSAQNPTTYFMEGSTFRSQWNPAFAPNKGYINIPTLGGIEIGTSGNLALDNVIINQGGELHTILNGAISSTTALADIHSKNYIGGNISLNLIGFGAYTKNQKNFWAVDISMRNNIDMQAPYSFFDFMKTGTSQDISGLGVKGDSYLEASFSYSLPITDKLYVGARAKILFGVARARFYFDHFDAQLNETYWSANAVGVMELSGFLGEHTTNADGTHYYDNFDSFKSVNKPAGYGFGIDLGVTYDILPQLQLSASINDIGAMFWSKKHSVMGRADEQIIFNGVEIDGNGNATQPEFDLDDIKFRVADEKGISESLATSLNLGAEYNFLDRRIGLGLFYNTRFYEYKTRHNITASANFRPLKWLHASGSFSFINNDAKAVGLALNLCPRWINFFIGTDILLSKKTPQWIPVSQSNMNITFGLGIPIGRSSQRDN